MYSGRPSSSSFFYSDGAVIDLPVNELVIRIDAGFGGHTVHDECELLAGLVHFHPLKHYSLAVLVQNSYINTIIQQDSVSFPSSSALSFLAATAILTSNFPSGS
jgi:hypothetical protein